MEMEGYIINCFHFWVYPQRLVYIGRRFGTLYRVQLQRLEVQRLVYIGRRFGTLCQVQLQRLEVQRLVYIGRRFGTLCRVQLQRLEVQRLVYIGRRFGTLCRVHLQRLEVCDFKPLKMDPTESSETSANINQTLGIHPKVETVKTNTT
jgi:hypothetical protein